MNIKRILVDPISVKPIYFLILYVFFVIGVSYTGTYLGRMFLLNYMNCKTECNYICSNTND